MVHHGCSEMSLPEVSEGLAGADVLAQRILAGKIPPGEALADDHDLLRIGAIRIVEKTTVTKRDIHHAKITRRDVLNDGILLLAALPRRVLLDRKNVFADHAALGIRDVRHNRGGFGAGKAV